MANRAEGKDFIVGDGNDEEDKGKSIETSWSWVVMVSSFLVQSFLMASSFLPSSYYIILHEEYEKGLGVVSWIGAVNTSLFLLLGPLSSTLCNWFGSRIVLIAGALVASFGLLISGMVARSVPVFILTLGVIPGLGIGLAFTPSVIIVGFYFDKHRPLATGIALSGIGAGIFFYPPLAQWLIDIVGWRASLVILAGFPLQAVVLAMFMRPVDARVLAKLLRNESKDKGYVEKANEKDIHAHLAVFKKTKFLVLLFVYSAVTFGISVVFFHMVAFAQTQGIDGHKASLMFSAAGIANFAGRLFFSLVGQHPKVVIPVAHFTAFVIAGIVTPVCPLIRNSYTGFIIYAVLFGFFVAPHGVYMQNLAERFLGFYHFGIGMGYIAMMAGIGTLIGPPVAGVIYDNTGSYTWTFIIGGISLLVGMAAFAPLAFRDYCSCRSSKAKVPQNDNDNGI